MQRQHHGFPFLALISASWQTLCIRSMSCSLPLRLFNSNLVLFTIIYRLTRWLHLLTPSPIMPQSLISTVWTWWHFVAVSCTPCGHLQFLLVQGVHSSTCFQLHCVPHTCETATAPLNLPSCQTMLPHTAFSMYTVTSEHISATHICWHSIPSFKRKSTQTATNVSCITVSEQCWNEITLW